jgi:hypothetical protein
MARKFCSRLRDQRPVEVSCTSPHNEPFELFRRGLEDSYAIILPAVEFAGLKEIKQFCVGLLTGRDHPWFRPISRLRLRDRLSVAGSLFLFRKTLPSDSPSVGDYLDKMEVPAPDPPVGFMRFVSDEMDRMFPRGWDRGWESAVDNAVVTTSSCLERSRKDGGARALLTWVSRSFVDRAEFCASLRAKSECRRPNVSLARIARAPCDGKVRLVSVNSVDMTWIKPYHTLLYDFISRKDWCLRGDAKASSFPGFVQVPGEVFVSGDYESATDNLNQDVARHILGIIGRRCTRVPLFVREASLRTLGGMLTDGKRTVVQRRGQLMGNAMSFPLLCLQNYLAFRFLVRREGVPVRINGDDIVFRARPEEIDSWTKGVAACGLKLSLGKTNFEQRWFSLNSSFFVAGRKNIRCAPVIRSTAVLKPLAKAEDLKERFESLRGLRSDRRVVWEKILLSRVGKTVWASQMSLRRGLGCRVSRRAIIESGLRDREIFYESLPSVMDQSVTVTHNYLVSSIPSGWYRFRSATRSKTPRAFLEALVDECWYPELSSPEDFVVKQSRTARYVRKRPLGTLRLAGHCIRAMIVRGKKECLQEVSRLGWPRWNRLVEGGSLWQRPISFKAGGFHA